MTDQRLPERSPFRKFLTAEWRYLAMANFAVDPAILKPFVPRGTELDTWHNTHYLSLVAFLFLNTRVLKLPIPLHRNFEEVNLRFYVRAKGSDGWRRGVVFIKEVVPRLAVAAVARAVYNEPYAALPMSHGISLDPSGIVREIYYSWGKRAKAVCELTLSGLNAFQDIAEDSEALFITEHHWGYTRQRDGSTIEYHVEHPRWRVAIPRETILTGPFESLYGQAFGEILRSTPTSVFLADGSATAVYRGRSIESSGAEASQRR